MENTSANFTNRMMATTEMPEVRELDKNLLRNYYGAPEAFNDSALELYLRDGETVRVLAKNLHLMDRGTLTARISKGTPEERQATWRKRIRDEDHHLAYFKRKAEGGTLFQNNLLTRIRDDLFVHYGVEEEQFEATLIVQPDEHTDVSEGSLKALFDSFTACIEIESTLILTNCLMELSYMGHDYPQQAAKLHQLHHTTLRSSDLLGKIHLAKQLGNLFESAARKERKDEANLALVYLAGSCDVMNTYMFNFLSEFGEIYEGLGHIPPSLIQDGLLALHPPKKEITLPETDRTQQIDTFNIAHDQLTSVATATLQPLVLSSKKMKGYGLGDAQYAFINGRAPGRDKPLLADGIPREHATAMAQLIHALSERESRTSVEDTQRFLFETLQCLGALQQETVRLQHDAQEYNISNVEYPAVLPFIDCAARLVNPEKWPGIESIITETWPNGRAVAATIRQILFADS